MLNRTVQSYVLRNTARNKSESVQNLRQQMTGRTTNTNRGTYARLATSEPKEQQEPVPSEPRNVAEEIMPLLHKIATRIQRLNRKIRQIRVDADRRYQKQTSREFDKNMMRTRQKELQRNQDAINELDQILRQDALQQSPATRIQSAVRKHRATNETIKRTIHKT